MTSEISPIEILFIILGAAFGILVIGGFVREALKGAPPKRGTWWKQPNNSNNPTSTLDPEKGRIPPLHHHHHHHQHPPRRPAQAQAQQPHTPWPAPGANAGLQRPPPTYAAAAAAAAAAGGSSRTHQTKRDRHVARTLAALEGQ